MLEGIDPMSFLSGALGHQVTQFGVAFAIAAWIHSGRVKQEIKLSMGAMTCAVDNLAKVLRADLDEQRNRVGVLTTRVEALEKPRG